MREVSKPWGCIKIFADTKRYRGEILYIDAGKMISRHIHDKKDETWLINKGRIIAHIGDDKKMMVEGDTIDIPHGTIHRAEALLDSEIIEWCTPELSFRRLQDEYGRLDEY